MDIVSNMKIENKDKILEECAALIGAGEDFSLALLADQLEIKKASLYHYFGSKEEMLFQMHAMYHKRLLAKGYRITFSGSLEKDLENLVSHWSGLYLSKDFFLYLRALMMLRFKDERAAEESRSLSLMLSSQSRVVLEHYLGEKKDAETLYILFSSLLEKKLEDILLYQREEGDIGGLAAHFARFISH